MPANGLRVNHYDFVALHSMWIIFSKGFMCLSTSGNYTTLAPVSYLRSIVVRAVAPASHRRRFDSCRRTL